MKKRIVAIDVLRGFALLGILLMNMASYAMPTIAYFNPTAYGGDDIWNRLVFNLSHIFADQKMMALFSMLFGASVMLVTNNLEKKGKSPFSFHYLRNFWLLMIGLIHAILIWDGDILVIYALCSFVLYWLRKVSPQWQLILGLSIFFLPSVVNIGIDALLPDLTAADYQYIEGYWQPSEEAIAAELQTFRGPYGAQLAHRLASAPVVPYTDGQGLLELSLVVEFFSRAFGMMLIGMALFTWGILTGKRSDEFYQRMAQIGFGVGLPLGLISLFQYTIHDWNPLYSLFLGRIPNHMATPFVAGGYIAVIMLWSRSDNFTRLRNRLAAVGRMALTNYIGQSIIGTFIFYGFGLGLFGSFDRVQQLMVIVLIWAGQIWFSGWWLERFQYGPLEWVWRLLSHRRWQPIMKKVAVLERV
ncbi:MAG: DUF418 domain-containing protein [Ardenticatenaceae bacterium]|nr:DUF418 domain-containing protein [Ardenticatenaceae bacterium]